MACFDAIIVTLARPTMPCIHLVLYKPYTLRQSATQVQGSNIIVTSFSSEVIARSKDSGLSGTL